MARAAEHAQFNFLAVSAASALVQHRKGQVMDSTPWAMGAVAACLPSLPDLFEPALHPNHRGFFHSVTAYLALSHVMNRLYRWEAADDWQRVLRLMCLAGGAAYLAHLTRDAFTPRSLPLY